MLKPINQVANRVAEGRKTASRSIVLTSLSKISAMAYRRELIDAEDNKTREESLYEDGILLSTQGEHAVEYKDLGCAMFLFDRFSGGSIHADGEDINSGEAIIYAQIEPFFYEDYESPRKMLRNIPDWKPIKGDIFALVIDEELIKWVEVIGVSGQSVHSHYGERYILNVRDKLSHLEPFISEDEVLNPNSNEYPRSLSELTYSSTPLFDVIEVDGEDDEIVNRIFKLIKMQDSKFSNAQDVGDIVQLNNQTNSNFYFSEDVGLIIDKERGETFVLSSEVPVKAIENTHGYFTSMLIVVDNKNIVLQVSNDVFGDKKVIISGAHFEMDLEAFHFNDDKSIMHFIVPVYIAEKNRFELTMPNGQAYIFNIDASELSAD